MSEQVNHPAHYQGSGVECIDAMLSAFGTVAVAQFCKLNAFKYIWRGMNKGKCLEDTEKALWYLNKYKELISGESNHKSNDDNKGPKGDFSPF